MKVRLLEVPYHLGRERTSMGRGPGAFVQAGAADALAERGHEVWVESVERPEPFLDEVGAVFGLNRALAASVRAALVRGEFPLVLSGNCNSAVGILAGIDSPEIGAVWFDAHGDFNTPQTTPSGFLDGMALAIVTGRCWADAARAIEGFSPLDEAAVVLVAARDLDPGERELLERSSVRRVEADALRRAGAAALAQPLADLARRAPAIYLHVDLDALDPAEAPANAYAAAGGLSLALMEEALRAIRAQFVVRAAALTSYDPGSDPEGAACRSGLRLMQALAA